MILLSTIANNAMFIHQRVACELYQLLTKIKRVYKIIEIAKGN